MIVKDIKSFQPMKNKNYLSTQESKRNFFFEHDNFF